MLSRETRAQLIIRVATATSVRGAARNTWRAMQAGVPQSQIQDIARVKRIELKEANRAKRSSRNYDPNNGTGNPI